MPESLLEMIRRHEGYERVVYCDRCGRHLVLRRTGLGSWQCMPGCPGGNLTVAIGQRVDGDGIGVEQAFAMATVRVRSNQAELSRYHWYSELSFARQCAIQDMAYTMGVAGVLEFHEMMAALVARDWKRARDEVIASKWHDEAPSRAAEIAAILEDDVLPG